MKYTPDIVKKICDLIEKDNFTIVEICQRVGITIETFHTWKREKSDFSDSLKAAYEKQLGTFVEFATKSLVKKIQGFEYDETTTILIDNGKGQPKLKEKKTVKKYVPPSDVAIIFALTNRDPANWKHKNETDITTGGEKLNNIVFQELKTYETEPKTDKGD